MDLQDRPYALIIGAGEFDAAQEKLLQRQAGEPRPALVIAADGGYRYCRHAGIDPDILLGDFDSLGEVPDHPNLIRHPIEKDDTDMALAAELAVQKGCRRLFLYGGTGGRPDHLVANLQLLKHLSLAGVEAYLAGSGMIITALTGGTIRFPASFAGTLSVFCIGDKAEGVCEKGLKYTLDDAVITGDVALGVSNAFAGREAEVSVQVGTLLVFWEIGCGYGVERIGL